MISLTNKGWCAGWIEKALRDASKWSCFGFIGMLIIPRLNLDATIRGIPLTFHLKHY